MRIAQVAPLIESVPPKFYGGTERVVASLTEELVNQGHDVTLFASGDSVTHAHLEMPLPQSVRLDHGCKDPLAGVTIMLEQLAKAAARFDIIHFHTGHIHLPLVRRLPVPALTTIHGRIDLPELKPIFNEFRDMAFVAISNSQRASLPWANWAGTVYHGLPLQMYSLSEKQNDHLVFLGRISPEKRPGLAIKIAQRSRMKIKIAAKIDPVDYGYFKKEIEPLLEGPLVEYIGEVDDSKKGELLSNASALIFPIDWPEPFGLVMIEALACGTPVIAYGKGSVPEIIDDKETGFIVNNLDEAVQAVKKIGSLSRKHCREVFEKRFSAFRMTKDYLAIYQKLLKNKPKDVMVHAI